MVFILILVWDCEVAAIFFLRHLLPSISKKSIKMIEGMFSEFYLSILHFSPYGILNGHGVELLFSPDRHVHCLSSLKLIMYMKTKYSCNRAQTLEYFLSILGSTQHQFPFFYVKNSFCLFLSQVGRSMDTFLNDTGPGQLCQKEHHPEFLHCP